ncbi:MAG TPA: TetR/AcrR family transcriptional regulator [Candidatus Sulfobium mesophilum]|jgi:AcrR family transcriptional regulator|uniref:Transcriptional regulator, TetR family n=1 Tax=Candidatus Sulfobium mesophilum TaxID=2016548 RepID=A0A2U3QL27_9BACT|nr:Transcriptional regulator, TetR family [Candidatus Sulfobium mesophilum]HSB31494.1 TetR/AcrR family transcriptional regulator [Candidatus Sulfobium mesophilum]
MGVKEKRAKYKEEFRREILDSAREIFITDGYDGFSMRKLAGKIDYSPTTIYLYFKNKDELLFAICEEFFTNFLAELNNIRSVSQDPMETLHQAFLYLIEFGLRNPNQYKAIFFSKRHIYGTREEFVERESMARKTYLVFKEIIQDCIKAGRFRELDDEIIVSALAITSHGLVTTILCCPDFLNRGSDVIARSLVDALLKGYQK